MLLFKMEIMVETVEREREVEESKIYKYFGDTTKGLIVRKIREINKLT